MSKKEVSMELVEAVKIANKELLEEVKKAKKPVKKTDVEKDSKTVQISLRLKKELKPKIVQLAEDTSVSSNVMINRMIESYDPQKVEKLNRKIKTLTNKINKLEKQLDDIKG